jgi:hypothetical protein
VAVRGGVAIGRGRVHVICLPDHSDDKPKHQPHASSRPRQYVFEMFRQRRNLDQLASGSDSPQHSPNHQRHSEPSGFHEPIPTTLLGQLSYLLRELFHLSRHIHYNFIFGVGYDRTPEEWEIALMVQAQHTQHLQHLQHHNPEEKHDIVMLGYIRNICAVQPVPF